MTRSYSRPHASRVALRYRFITLMTAVAMLGGTVYLFRIMPKGFIPSQDSGFFFAFTMAGQDVSFDSMVRHEYTVSELVRKDPNVADVGVFLMGGNQGGFFVKLKPREERALTVDQTIAELRPKLFGVPGILAFPQNPPPITVSGQFTTSAYQLTLQSDRA